MILLCRYLQVVCLALRAPLFHLRLHFLAALRIFRTHFLALCLAFLPALRRIIFTNGMTRALRTCTGLGCICGKTGEGHRQ
jgi:hypothetical protein